MPCNLSRSPLRSHSIAPDVPLSQEDLHAVLNHHIISNQEPTSGEQAAHHQPNPSSYGLTWEDFGLRSDYLDSLKELNVPDTARPLGVRTPIRTPRKNGVQPLHAALERRAGAARLSPHAARHVHAYNRRAYGVQACQTGVQSLHACLKGVQSLHALRTGVQALHACRLT
ncbi:hypothetical protein PCANC_15866 [Puccinia coronata f. sp. avenae]|uniref:Uncharacterized protein n=1 Tax=Puccinia coronata f. sp. avenae TaxID=200324 RepID=A0A2N5UPZ1_9BASI|nr:hypothetical protein PCANC_15866 [Puccinia coronata f. sp. avenae]